MFLKRISYERRVLLSTKERGSALVGVLGIMAVTTVIALTVTTMSIHATGYTTATRAGVQAEAAAEAGIDFAAAHLAILACHPQYSNTSAPTFQVTVAYSTLQTSPGDVDTSWVSGCPTFADAKRLKLVSTGWASALGVAGSSSGNMRKVEAVFPYTPSSTPYGIFPSGAAIYSFAQADPTMNNLTVTQAGTSRPTIAYLSGSVTCNSGSTIVGDLILGNGAIAANGCTINGDLFASGGISITSGEVVGDVISAGAVAPSVSLSNSVIVDGDIYSAGPVSVSGKIGRNVTAGPLVGLSVFSSQSSVGGSVVLGGTISNKGVIKGTITQNQPGIVTPKIPFVPPWLDYSYDPYDWRNPDASFFSVLSMTACSASALADALITVQSSTTPIILDTRACGAVTNLGGGKLTLKSDTAIIANGFNLTWSDIESSDTSDKRLWIIIPDDVADRQPTCPTGSSATIANHLMVGSHVGAMIYSPCSIKNLSDVWRGQMYGSSLTSSKGFTLNYLPIGLPNVDLSTGGHTPPAGGGVLGDRTSIRDLVVD